MKANRKIALVETFDKPPEIPEWCPIKNVRRDMAKSVKKYLGRGDVEIIYEWAMDNKNNNPLACAYISACSLVGDVIPWDEDNDATFMSDFAEYIFTEFKDIHKNAQRGKVDVAFRKAVEARDFLGFMILEIINR